MKLSVLVALVGRRVTHLNKVAQRVAALSAADFERERLTSFLTTDLYNPPSPRRLDDRAPSRDLGFDQREAGAGPRCGLSGMSQPSVISRLRVTSSSSALSSAAAS